MLQSPIVTMPSLLISALSEGICEILKMRESEKLLAVFPSGRNLPRPDAMLAVSQISGAQIKTPQSGRIRLNVLAL